MFFLTSFSIPLSSSFSLSSLLIPPRLTLRDLDYMALYKHPSRMCSWNMRMNRTIEFVNNANTGYLTIDEIEEEREQEGEEKGQRSRMDKEGEMPQIDEKEQRSESGEEEFSRYRTQQTSESDAYQSEYEFSVIPDTGSKCN